MEDYLGSETYLCFQDDNRKQYTLSSFGFLNHGTLTVNVTKFIFGKNEDKVDNATVSNHFWIVFIFSINRVLTLIFLHCLNVRLWPYWMKNVFILQWAECFYCTYSFKNPSMVSSFCWGLFFSTGSQLMSAVILELVAIWLVLKFHCYFIYNFILLLIFFILYSEWSNYWLSAKNKSTELLNDALTISFLDLWLEIFCTMWFYLLTGRLCRKMYIEWSWGWNWRCEEGVTVHCILQNGL